MYTEEGVGDEFRRGPDAGFDAVMRFDVAINYEETELVSGGANGGVLVYLRGL
jgi:hypothetical protein